MPSSEHIGGGFSRRIIFGKSRNELVDIQGKVDHDPSPGIVGLVLSLAVALPFGNRILPV
jgi:hypothetical protein